MLKQRDWCLLLDHVVWEAAQVCSGVMLMLYLLIPICQNSLVSEHIIAYNYIMQFKIKTIEINSISYMNFIIFLLAHIKLHIVRGFIMTFTYMHLMYFDHIHPSLLLFLIPLLTTLFPCPSTCLILSVLLSWSFKSFFFYFPLNSTSEKNYMILKF